MKTNNWPYFILTSARIWSFPGPYFLAFWLNKEGYEVSLRIQSECWKIRTRKTPNSYNFNAARMCKLAEGYLLWRDLWQPNESLRRLTNLPKMCLLSLKTSYLTLPRFKLRVKITIWICFYSKFHDAFSSEMHSLLSCLNFLLNIMFNLGPT